MDASALHKFAPASELGPAENHPPGSIEWAERISQRLQIGAMAINEHTVHHLYRTIKAIWITRPQPWEIWPPGRPFGTPNDYCEAVTGHDWKFLVEMVIEFSNDPDLVNPDLFGPHTMLADLARAQAQHRTQGTRTDRLVADGNRLSKGSNQVAYLLRRLAREHPEVLDAYERGEFKSARAAGIAAGFIKPPTPLQQIQKLWPKLTPEERRAFLAEVAKALE